MVVEHEFVTTLEEEEAMQRAELALRAMGFERDAGAPGGGLVFKRGKKSASRARKVNQLPQVAAVQFDRGRVTVAASLEWPRKPKAPHKAMMMALAGTVERAVAEAGTGADVLAEWRAVNQSIDQQARRNSIIAWTVLGVLVAGIVALIGAAVSAF